jgi:hypothetical protein
MTKNHFHQFNNIINQISSQFTIIHLNFFLKKLNKYTFPSTSNILNMKTNTCLLLAFSLLPSDSLEAGHGQGVVVSGRW